MQRNKIKSFLDQLEDKYKSPNSAGFQQGKALVHKTKHGFIEIGKVGKK